MLKASAEKPTLSERSPNYEVQVTVHLLPANADHPIALSSTVAYPPSSEN